MVFGGSWGSTLSLAYAQTHPERVSEIILRGIFLFGQSELDWLYKYGASELYPDGWDEFLAPIPEAERGDLVAAYHRRLTGEDRALQVAAAKAWSKWEAETVTLLPNPHVIEEFTNDDFAVAIARIENHYMINKGWLAENQLLAGAAKLKAIAGVIVQGRHDCCTPPRAAWELKRVWPEVELNIVPDGGHLYNEPGILDGLIRATDKFAG
jgi:proline iminopeptidase